MNFSRSVDALSHSLASSQARIFERSVALGIPSKQFARCYLLSMEARQLDELNLDVAGLSEEEIFDSICVRIKTDRGGVYSFSVMHFMGYFYRMAAYLTGYSSKKLYQIIKPDFLNKNYPSLHALPIEEAVKEVFEVVGVEEEDKYALFKKIYRVDI